MLLDIFWYSHESWKHSLLFKCHLKQRLLLVIYEHANILASPLLLDLSGERQARYCTLLLTRSQRSRKTHTRFTTYTFIGQTRQAANSPLHASAMATSCFCSQIEWRGVWWKVIFCTFLILIRRFRGVFCCCCYFFGLFTAERAETKSLHALNCLGATSKQVCFSHLEDICL